MCIRDRFLFAGTATSEALAEEKKGEALAEEPLTGGTATTTAMVLIPTRVASDVTNMEKTRNEAPSSSGAFRGSPSLAAAAPPPPQEKAPPSADLEYVII